MQAFSNQLLLLPIGQQQQLEFYHIPPGGQQDIVFRCPFFRQDSPIRGDFSSPCL